MRRIGKYSRFEIGWQAHMQNICTFFLRTMLAVWAAQRHQSRFKITPNRRIIIGAVKIHILSIQYAVKMATAAYSLLTNMACDLSQCGSSTHAQQVLNIVALASLVRSYASSGRATQALPHPCPRQVIRANGTVFILVAKLNPYFGTSLLIKAPRQPTN